MSENFKSLKKNTPRWKKKTGLFANTLILSIEQRKKKKKDRRDYESRIWDHQDLEDQGHRARSYALFHDSASRPAFEVKEPLVEGGLREKDSLKVGKSTFYATMDFKRQKLIYERKDSDKHDGNRRIIHESRLLMEPYFYVFLISLEGCWCKGKGRKYRIKVEQN